MTGRAIDPLDQTHGLGASSRGNPAHDAWLGDRAMRNQETGDSRTFVIAENGRVIAYYALSTASVAPSRCRDRFNAMRPIPYLFCCSANWRCVEVSPHPLPPVGAGPTLTAQGVLAAHGRTAGG
ncbi:MAG: hypothetical protein WB902_17210, partial [Acetobacteraceae bacterium]